jgi:hypothetical protein
VRSPSTQGAARAAWSAWGKPSAACHKCRRPARASRGRCGTRALHWT